MWLGGRGMGMGMFTFELLHRVDVQVVLRPNQRQLKTTWGTRCGLEANPKCINGSVKGGSELGN